MAEIVALLRGLFFKMVVAGADRSFRIDHPTHRDEWGIRLWLGCVGDLPTPVLYDIAPDG